MYAPLDLNTLALVCESVSVLPHLWLSARPVARGLRLARSPIRLSVIVLLQSARGGRCCRLAEGND
jgi:hypothetical protein